MMTAEELVSKILECDNDDLSGFERLLSNQCKTRTGLAMLTEIMDDPMVRLKLSLIARKKEEMYLTISNR